MEFRRPYPTKPGDRFWIKIPLATWNNQNQASIECICECKWADKDEARMGGELVDLSDEMRTAIEKLLEDLRTTGRLAV